MTQKTTIDILRDAKALLETKGWAQGDYARDAQGKSLISGLCERITAEGTCFCGWGATVAATGGRWNQALPAMDALDAVSGGFFPGFNDAEGRTLPEVLAKFDEAIAAEEAKLELEVPA